MNLLYLYNGDWSVVRCSNHQYNVYSGVQYNAEYIRNFVFQVLANLNQTYWLDFGCLLGAARIGNILPHDGDCDFSRLGDNDVASFHALLTSLLRPYNIRVEKRTGYEHGVTRFKREFIQVGLKPPKQEFIQVDLFTYFKDPNGNTMSQFIDMQYVHEFSNSYAKYRRFYYESKLPIDVFLPTKYMTFASGKIVVPRDHWAVIKLRYPYTYWFQLHKNWWCW